MVWDDDYAARMRKAEEDRKRKKAEQQPSEYGSQSEKKGGCGLGALIFVIAASLLTLLLPASPVHAVTTDTDNSGVDVSVGFTPDQTLTFADTQSVEYDPPNPSCIEMKSENSYFKMWTFWCFGGGSGHPSTQDLKYVQIFNKSTTRRCFAIEFRRASPSNEKIDELGNPCTDGQTSLQVYPFEPAHPESEKLYIRAHRFDLSTWYYHRPHYPSYGPGTATILKFAAGTWTC